MYFMQYTPLANKEVVANQQQQIDIDGDQRVDFSIEAKVTTDALVETISFEISSSQKNYSFIEHNNENGLVTIPALNLGDTILTVCKGNKQWKASKNMLLVKKIYSFSDDETIWEGNWKAAQNKYLPIQVSRNGGYYNGWIELSVDALNDKIILHRAALINFSDRDIIVKP
jgi:hypothetical protein